MDLAWWILLAFTCGSVTAKYQNDNRIELHKVLANIPENVVNQAQLFLEDPSRLVTFILSTENRVRRKRSIGYKEYHFESLNARVNISFDREEKPLEGFKAEVSIDRLGQLLNVNYEKATFAIDFTKINAKSFNLRVHYIFYQFKTSKEIGTISLDYLSEGPSRLYNIKQKDSVGPVIPKFSFIIKPHPEDKPEIPDNLDENKTEISDNSAEEQTTIGYEDVSHKQPLKNGEEQDFEIEKRDISYADAATLFIGNFTGWDSKEYLIKIRDTSKGWYMSERRKQDENYIKRKDKINPMFDGILLNEAEKSFRDIIIGYHSESKRTRSLLLDENSEIHYEIKAKLNTKKSYITIKEQKEVRIETKFETNSKGWEIQAYYQNRMKNRVFDLNFSSYKNSYRNIAFLFKFIPTHLISMCPNQAFRLCKSYEIKADALIDKMDMKKVDISAKVKRGTENLMSMKLSTQRTPYSFSIESSRYLPSILPETSEKFELEIRERQNVYTISKASLEDLKFWKAVKADSDWTLKLNDTEICTVFITHGTDLVELATRVPDKFNTTITTSISWDSNDWKEKTVNFDTYSNKRVANAKIAWNVSSLFSTDPQLKDIKFEISGNGGKEDKFGVFNIQRELVINPSNRNELYLYFNTEETIYNNNPESYRMLITKEPIEITIKS